MIINKLPAEHFKQLLPCLSNGHGTYNIGHNKYQLPKVHQYARDMLAYNLTYKLHIKYDYG